MSVSSTADKAEKVPRACHPEILEVAIDVVYRVQYSNKTHPITQEDLDWLSAMAEIYPECAKLERLI